MTVDIVLPPEEERITVGDVIEDFLAVAEYQRAAGPAAIPTPSVRDITGHTPRSFQQFVADHRSTFAPRAAA